jgi:hypothetical protein
LLIGHLQAQPAVAASAGAAPARPAAAAAPPPPFRSVRRLRVLSSHPSLQDAAAWLPRAFPDVSHVDCSAASHVPEEWLAPLLRALPALRSLRVDGLRAWQGRASLPAAAPRLRRLDARGTALDLCSNDAGWLARGAAACDLTRLSLGGAAHGLWRCQGHGLLKCALCQARAGHGLLQRRFACGPPCPLCCGFKGSRRPW